MASPQTAHGYTKIANAIMRALFRFPMSGQELRLILWVLRDSYGWRRKVTGPAPLQRITEETGIPRSTVSYTVNKLTESGVLIEGADKTLTFNKNYEAWLLSGAGMLPLKAAEPAKARKMAGPKPAPQPTFTPPTVEQVRAFCAERKLDMDPEKFWHHYESTGWVKGHAKLRNWKSAACYWALSNFPGKGKPSAGEKVCPICNTNPIRKNVSVCQACGSYCRRCGRDTPHLRIIKRKDGTTTAVCSKGCLAAPPERSGLVKADAGR